MRPYALGYGVDWRVIEARELTKIFTGPDGAPVVAVDHVSLSVHEGEVLGLLGPNGAGKTTLLRMLATMIRPTSGACDVNGYSAAGSFDALRAHIGFLSGNTKLYGRLTGRELLRYFGKLYGMPATAIARRTQELVELLDMGTFISQRCDTLSTGQSQRVSIARVILHDPKILILDEPTLGLDIMTSASILEFISAARARGHAIIFSTHHMSDAELLCDRVALMHKGRIMACDTKEALYAASGCTNLHDAFLWFVRASGRTAA